MEYFSFTAFYVGVFIAAVTSTTTLCYCLICMIWKVKILEVAQFGSSWFSIFKDKIFGIDFKLGWLPFGSSMNPLGALDDPEERSKIEPSNLQYALFSKPKYVKYLINFTPLLVCIISFFVIIFISKEDLIDGTSSTLDFTLNTLKEIFRGSEHRAAFIIYAEKIISGKNHIYFSFLVADLLYIAISIPNLLSNFLYALPKFSEKAKERIQILAFLLYAWIIFWEIPKFTFSLFGFTKSLIYIFSFTVGLFTLGLVFFFTCVFVLKSIEQNLNYKSEKA